MKKENIEIINIIYLNSSSKDLMIYGLEEGEEKYYKLLGKSSGINLAHCFFMGHKHKKAFAERVFAYKVISNDKTLDVLKQIIDKEYMTVEFYELI